ncbi:unnamed protein product [Spirodela intermedia]|uniref:Uncharacterized protein n=1 Tax=Spirodela intermedia TaxID=51605 RepID=A0A7I8K9J8_SPIIN|nr:unnamed protein product [Spirodela intermedia]
MHLQCYCSLTTLVASHTLDLSQKAEKVEVILDI